MFHKVANGRRNKNCICPLIKDNGERTHSDKEVEEEVLSVFSDMLSPIIRPRTFGQGIEWCPISSKEGEELKVSFTVEKMKKVVFGSDRNKSLGQNNFSMACSKDNWNILKVDLENVSKEFFVRFIMNYSLSKISMCLISNKEDAKQVKKFKPIDHVTNVYKILAKVLANHLRKVLP